MSGEGDLSIQGFATDISVDAGQTIGFKVGYRIPPTTASRSTASATTPGSGRAWSRSCSPRRCCRRSQPACLNDLSTGLNDCGNWALSATWAVPANATSGIYIAKLVREDPEDGRASHIRRSSCATTREALRFSFRPSDTTWQAYNQYGGNSLYVGSPDGRAYKVSYNRPFTTPRPDARGLGLQRRVPDGALARGATATTSATRPASTPTGAAPRSSSTTSTCRSGTTSTGRAASAPTSRPRGDAGVQPGASSAATRCSGRRAGRTSIDGSDTPVPHPRLPTRRRTRTPRSIRCPASGPGPGAIRASARPPTAARPRTRSPGTIFTVNCCSYAMTVPAADGKMRFWRNTSVATLPPAATATLSDETVGYEWDEDLDNGFRPAGPDSPLDHDQQRPRAHPRLRLQLRAWNGHASSDAAPPSRRRRSSSRRQRAVVVGPRRRPRPRQPAARRAHATGDGQSARRHGRAAGDAAGRPGRSKRIDRHGAAHRDHHLADQRRSCRQRRAGNDHRHGESIPAAVSSAASRCRSTAARRGIPPADARAGATPGADRQRRREHLAAAPPTTAPTRAAVGGGERPRCRGPIRVPADRSS